MNNLRDLEAIGIPKPASTIYLSLIELGKGNITDIAEQAGLYRPLVYKNMQFLIGKNLVTKVKQGKRWMYMPEPPVRLEVLLDESKQSALTFIADLGEKYSRKSKGVTMSYHEGKSGIKKVFEEIIRKSKKGDIIYRYESPIDYKKNSIYYPEIYWKKATGQLSEIEKRTITNEKTAQRRSKTLSRETRYIPTAYDQFEYNITQLISKDQVAFIDYQSETAILIRGKRFAEFQSKIFNLFFKKI